MPWSVQDYGCWYVSKELLIFILVLTSNLLQVSHGQDDKVSDNYGYNTGSKKFECPDGDWFIVGAQCFKLGTKNGNIQIVNFDDANTLCLSPE